LLVLSAGPKCGYQRGCYSSPDSCYWPLPERVGHTKALIAHAQPPWAASADGTPTDVLITGQEARAQQGALRAEGQRGGQPAPIRDPPAAITGVGPTASTIMGSTAMLAIQPTCPPPSVPCATIMSAPAILARSASGTVRFVRPAEERP
jgi:hypothetical protein